MQLKGVLDHAKQAFFLRLAVDIPGGVKDFVAAVLRVGLRKHHQLNVAGVTLQRGEAIYQIIDFVIRQRQTQAVVGLCQSSAAARQHINPLEGLGLGVGKQAGSGIQIGQSHFSHAVMQLSYQLRTLRGIELAADVIGDATFQPGNLTQATVAGDVGRFARPGRDGAKTRHHQHQFTGWLLHCN